MGCSGDEPAEDTATEAPAEETAEAEPSEEATEETAEEEAAAPSGDVAAPGDTAGLGEWLSLPFEVAGDDGGSAVIDVTVTEIEAAPDADQKALQEEISQLKGMTVYYLWADMKKNSGDEVAYSSIASEFYAVDENSEQLQNISLIGWDSCPSESFTTEFDEGETLSTCFAAAVPDSQPAPAGGAWNDFEDYNIYDGNALYWLQ
ncbi:hypothetical protein ACNHYB_12260 [Isoptericola jiangsuensis]|uniref:hypothetical protein n=1 Tax=Isoptericola jiangsuensis TaxID=548579 RepID=UPI003AABF7B5